MRVKRGAGFIIMPNFSRIENVVWGDPLLGPKRVMAQISVEQLLQYRRKTLMTRGYPVYFATLTGKDDVIELHFWPTPAENGQITVTYAPPLCQI